MDVANIDITDAESIEAKTSDVEASGSGMASDRTSAKADETETEEQRFERLYLESNKMIFREHSQHEIYYKTLKLVSANSDEKTLLAGIRSLPEMKVALRTPRYYLEALLRTGALVREPIESDETGAGAESTADNAAAPVSTDAAAATSAADAAATSVATTDAAADVAATASTRAASSASTKSPMNIKHYRWYLSPVGEQLIKDLSPVSRLDVLLARDEKAAPIFTSILSFCQTPRKRSEIESHLEETGKLDGIGALTSFFVDELEQNGGLVWTDAWTTTKEGETVLKKG